MRLVLIFTRGNHEPFILLCLVCGNEVVEVFICSRYAVKYRGSVGLHGGLTGNLVGVGIDRT